MVHLRLNAKESSPNPYVNFITSLSASSSADQDDAKQLLMALAAQVKPVMKKHGFTINSLEEYEYNQVFAGRNWEAGETVELVLRGPNGSFRSIGYLLSTFTHELAHIRHMHHGPAFQKLWRILNAEVRALRSKGYYGDGYWSSGTRLGDSSTVDGKSCIQDEAGLPEFLCGGAQKRTRPTARRRRRRGPPRQAGPSLHTGAQTAKTRKAGSRVTATHAFIGEGSALSSDRPGSRGKQAKSKRARDERALAAERRLRALQNSASATMEDKVSDHNETGSDSEDEPIPETDSERRRALQDAQENNDVSQPTWDMLDHNFLMFEKDEQQSPNEDVDDIDSEVEIVSQTTPQSDSSSRPLDSVFILTPEASSSKAFGEEWSCRVCTLINPAPFLSCSACSTIRGEEAPPA